MQVDKLDYYYKKFKYGEEIFHKLIKKRVRSILLVSTFYDAYIFEQEGRLSDQLFGEYRQLNLSTAPRIINVPSGERALEEIKNKKYDLVITMLRIGKVTPFDLSRKIKQLDPNLPIFLLLNIKNDILLIDKDDEKMKYIDNVFSWNGDSKIFLAMVKYIEDVWNVQSDTEQNLVRVILLIEDSIQYYSIFLPLLYEEIVKQTQKLIEEELNDHYKLLRRRARPKVLLCHSYEEAMEIYYKYKEYIITIISDARFKFKGKIDINAGIKLIRNLQKDDVSVPILLQSSGDENARKAEELGVQFIRKYSPSLLTDLKYFIINNLGFGDFVFRNENGEEIERAVSMVDFEEKLKTITDESVLYHSSRNHFSTWLIAHGEFLVAKRIRSLYVEDFKSVDDLKQYLLSCFSEVRKLRYRGKIIDFSNDFLKNENGIILLSQGSLGGKGRGLAFLNSLITALDYDTKYENVIIRIPRTFIIGTDEFDLFLRQNKIEKNIIDLPDDEIGRIFMQGKLSENFRHKLAILLEKIDSPLAIRSSGLLEDSQTQPFAGIYETYMLPNNNPDPVIRLKQLTNAVKLVFSTVFYKNARNYIAASDFKMEEEKMAVVIQEIVGSEYDGYFYPHLSGVAQSYNFYPIFGLKNSDGITNMALGLGKTVVDGMKSFKFCSRFPKLEFLQPEDYLDNSQTEFLALDLKKQDFNLLKGEIDTYAKLDLDLAEKHGTLAHIASVWDYENKRILDGLDKPGYRIIKFAHILKYNYFPLAEILTDFLSMGEIAMGVPVEIEFAVELAEKEDHHQSTFNILQIRPLTVNKEKVDIDFTNIPHQNILIYSEKGLGNGERKDIKDLIFYKQKVFNKTNTYQMANEIERINHKLNKKDRKYILIGPGRWGTRDRFLGIPVKWDQVDSARLIVETTLPGFEIDASQGTHFFHNIISFGVGYLTVPYRSAKDFINWDLLMELEATSESDNFIHLEFKKPLNIKIDGRSGRAVVYL